jgi:hypothetical protein
MIEIMHKIITLLLAWLEPVGIISGLVFSGIALRNDTKARRVENHIKIVDGYREIWSAILSDPKLERILWDNLDLNANPISAAEDRLVRFIFQNVLLAFEARSVGQLGDIGNLEKDVTEFISHPIPKTVWKEIARFQPEIFRKFIEGLM